MDTNELEAILEKGIEYIEHVRLHTSKHKVNNPGFVSLLAALAFADTHNIDFNLLINKLYTNHRYRSTDSFRKDFLQYKRYRDAIESILDEPDNYFIH